MNTHPTGLDAITGGAANVSPDLFRDCREFFTADIATGLPVKCARAISLSLEIERAINPQRRDFEKERNASKLNASLLILDAHAARATR